MDPVPNPQYVFLNRTSNLWCPVKGAPAPYIVWRKDGDVVQNSTSITFELNITSKNDVNYSCEVRRDGEVLRRNISLIIEGEVSLFLLKYISTFRAYFDCLNPYFFICSKF